VNLVSTKYIPSENLSSVQGADDQCAVKVNRGKQTPEQVTKEKEEMVKSLMAKLKDQATDFVNNLFK
jgi:hypothetical protein